MGRVYSLTQKVSLYVASFTSLLAGAHIIHITVRPDLVRNHRRRHHYTPNRHQHYQQLHVQHKSHLSPERTRIKKC